LLLTLFLDICSVNMAVANIPESRAASILGLSLKMVAVCTSETLAALLTSI
jgi:hypothetical protein